MSLVRSLGLAQILIIIIVAAALILSWDFGRRILETVQLIQADQAAQQELEQDQQINAQLKQLQKDVTTDDWVIKKARVDMHYARENETLFIPATTPAAPPTAATLPPAAPPTHSFWQDVIEALVGKSP
jgi:cell division protein FtsB